MDIHDVGSAEIEKLLRQLAPIPDAHGTRFLYGASCEGFVKIGYASNLANRFGSFRNGCPFPVECAFEYGASTAAIVVTEKLLHAHFAERRHRGEWFRIEPAELHAIYKGIDRVARWATAEHSRLVVYDDEYRRVYRNFEKVNLERVPQNFVTKVGLAKWGKKPKTKDFPNKTC